MANYLKFNDSKTEFLLFGCPHLCSKLPDNISVTIGETLLSSSPSARNIGAVLDSNLQMHDHVTAICQSCYIHIRNIGRIRRYLTKDAAEKLIHAFVSDTTGTPWVLPNSLLSTLSVSGLYSPPCGSSPHGALVKSLSAAAFRSARFRSADVWYKSIAALYKARAMRSVKTVY